MVRQIVENCRAGRGGQGVPLTVCGEMAGVPLEAMTLVGLGVRRLSMSAAAIGPVKAMVRSLDIGVLEDFVARLTGSGEHSLRNRLGRPRPGS